jgi:hypothetical protein
MMLALVWLYNHLVFEYDFSRDTTKINMTTQNHYFVKVPLCYRRSECNFQIACTLFLFLVVFIAKDVICAGKTSLVECHTFIK